MARKKRKFIDKKNAVSFKLVERSQNDPLFVDESAPQYVLVEKQSKQEVPLDDDDHEDHNEDLDDKDQKPSTTRKPVDRREEQIKFGIYFDDDYDYLQHLVDVKELPSAVGIEIQPSSNQKDQTVKVSKGLMLPSSVFESTVREKVDLSRKAALPVGPQLDWDPDIVEAMCDDFDFDDPQNQMDDDFVVKAMQSSSTDLDAFESDYKYDFSYKNMDLVPVEEGEEEDDDDDEEEDEEGCMLSDDNLSLCGYNGSDEGEDFEEEDESRDTFNPNSIQAKVMNKKLVKRYFGLEEDEDDRKTHKTSASTHFSEYSMSSSILPRNDQLKLLDEKFEQMFIREYADDTEIGALDCEEIMGTIDPNSSQLMQSLVEEFQEAKGGPLEYQPNREATQYVLQQYLKRDDNNKNRKEEEEDSSSTDTEVEEIMLQDPGRKGDQDRFDCESILSTMSNTLYHPKVLRETDRYGAPLVPRCRPKSHHIRIDPKTGIPTGTFGEDHSSGLNAKNLASLGLGTKSTVSHLSRISELSIRPKEETPEERRARKKELKEYRAARRVEKKANRLAFGAESQKLHRTELNKAVQKKVAVL